MSPEQGTTKMTESMEDLVQAASDTVASANRMLDEANETSVRLEAKMKAANLSVMEVSQAFEAAEGRAREIEAILIVMKEVDDRILGLSEWE